MRVRWSEHAVEQLQTVLDALSERRSVAAGRNIVDRLLDQIEAIGELPWSAPSWQPAGDLTFRRLVVGEHIVIYRVDEAEDSVFVLAIRHGRQRPLARAEVPDR